MPPHPLHIITQVIYVDTKKYLLNSTVTDETWNMRVFLDDEGSVKAWAASEKLSKVKGQAEQLASAAKGGFLHVDIHKNNIELQFHPPGEDIISFTLKPSKDDHASVLLHATLSLLEPTTGSTQASEIRSLRHQVTQKEIEISTLNARLASAKATAARATGTDKRKVPISPQKKVPANASGLQPNQKRRKAVQDEFAGSSDEEDEDEED